jgi:hypothetical protein
MYRTLISALAVCLLLGAGTTAKAAGLDLTFDFNPSATNGAVGGSNYTPPVQSGFSSTVYGYNINNTPHDLYWKQAGPNEHGIGFTNPDTGGGSHELSLTLSGGAVANYMEIDVSGLYHYFTAGNIRVQSIDPGSQSIAESYDIYGSNSLGSIGTVLTSGVGTAFNNLFVSLPNWGTYPYYTVAVHPQPNANLNDVLFDAIEVTPEPATLSLLALGGGLALWRRRKTSRR